MSTTARKAHWPMPDDDRGPLPAAREDASDAVWAEYDRCCDALDGQLDVIRRRLCGHVSSAAERRAADRPSGWAAATQEIPAAREALRIAREHNRICPRPAAWRKLYLLLPIRQDGGCVLRAPYPIDSASMRTSTHVAKRGRLRSQIEWAAATNALPRVTEFLRAMREDEWHHLGDAD